MIDNHMLDYKEYYTKVCDDCESFNVKQGSCQDCGSENIVVEVEYR